MIRFLLVVITVVGFLILSAPLILFQRITQKKNLFQTRWRSLSIVQGVFRLVLFLSGVKVIVKGKENIPANEPVLYVGNHRSYFDILIGYTQVPGLTGFVAKKEMEKIPLLSSWMDLVCCLFLDRKDIKEGLKTILKGIDYIKQGISIWIFPEGTRNANPESTELMDFKEGSLKIAEKSGCPIIPVALMRVDDIFEKHFPFICPQTVTVIFGEPIYLKQLEKEERKFAGAYTRQRIITMLEGKTLEAK